MSPPSRRSLQYRGRRRARSTSACGRPRPPLNGPARISYTISVPRLPRRPSRPTVEEHGGPFAAAGRPGTPGKRRVRRDDLLSLNRPHAMQDLPTFSLVIPTHNRADSLRRTLDSALALEYPPELLEVLVVENASTDATRAVTAEFEARG